MRPKIDALLERFGLAEAAEQSISAYSKGMKQKTLLIAALLHDPELLILDEPESGLDVGLDPAPAASRPGARGARPRRPLQLSRRRKRRTAVTRVIVLSAGRIVIDGNVDSIRTIAPVRIARRSVRHARRAASPLARVARSRTSSPTMRRRLLVRHFFNQFVENDFSPRRRRRHQLLAVAAAALITMPLFATVFMSVKYLMQPLQAPGWTQITTMGDQMIFCATSLLVSAAIATLEWEALALSPRDSMILGVLPVPRREIVRAKVQALVTFAAAFVIALNGLPTVLHPPLTVANFQANPLLLVPLVAAHGLSTAMAGAFGFACVVGLREFLFLCLGDCRFSRVCGDDQIGIAFFFPGSAGAGADPAFRPADLDVRTRDAPVLLQPVSWFAAAHGAIAGRVLDRMPTP